ncbi:MAG: hypothetical protein EBS55_13650 [Flavobacteriaceae bacterium]|nr:hypothetical protein [Flavobacteriaceae bacterium]
MAKGGGIEKGIDLFEDYDNIPNNVQSILDKYSSAFEDGEYKGLENALKELNKIGYTFDYDLEGQAYDLRKTSQKGKSSYAKGGGFSSFMSNVKSLRKTGLSKTKEAYGKTKEYVKGKVHDQKKKIALDVIYDAKENLPIKREEVKALDKAFRVVEEKYANGGGVMEKKYVIYELAFGQPYNFYNEEQDKFIWSEPTKATLFTKKEAENKRAELLKQRIEHYQSTGKHYRELHIGGKTNKEISDMYWQEAEDIDKEINSDRGGETSGPNWERIEKLEKERDRYRKLAIKYDSKMRRGGGVGDKKFESAIKQQQENINTNSRNKTAIIKVVNDVKKNKHRLSEDKIYAVSKGYIVKSNMSGGVRVYSSNGKYIETEPKNSWSYPNAYTDMHKHIATSNIYTINSRCSLTSNCVIIASCTGNISP